MIELNKSNIHPDMLEERKKSTFDKDLLTYLLDGSQYLTKKRRNAEKLFFSDKKLINRTDSSFLSRSELYTEAIEKVSLKIKLQEANLLLDRADIYFLSNLVFPNEASPITLHEVMFKQTLESQGSPEQKLKWLQKAENYEILGTYVQTELGHGTNIRGLETTAVYDPVSQEFILHSPTLTSIKWWPGGLGKTCNFAIVMALLYTNGECHGIHGFIVQLRDLITHEPLSGITAGDIGPKFGYNSIDNGFLKFDKHRIPRENMLMKNAEVSKIGIYKKLNSSKLTYGSMIFIRAMVVLDQAARALAQAVTIAIRYSIIRRQSEYKPGDIEPQIIEYQAQQYKLFTELSKSYAFYFAGLKIRSTYFDMNYEIQQGNLAVLPELHALSASLKASTTDGSMLGIEQCRLACGGHGYSCASGFPKIYVHLTAACTYEGENTVLYLQTARYLIKILKNAENNSSIYLTNNETCNFTFPLPPSSYVLAYQVWTRFLANKASNKLNELIYKGHPSYEAWNLSHFYLIKAAKAYSYTYIVSSFYEKLKEIYDDESYNEIHKVLYYLYELYSLQGIINNFSDFIEACKFPSTPTPTLDSLEMRLLELLKLVRPHCLSLVDSFDFTDHLLGSVLGRYDGRVYENLVEWAVKSPLNDKSIHDSFQFLKPLLQKSKL